MQRRGSPSVTFSFPEERNENWKSPFRYSECVQRCGYECIRSRSLWLRVKIGTDFYLGVYSPDMSKPLEEREEFWADVRDILVKCDRYERIVILGYFNGWEMLGKFPGKPKIFWHLVKKAGNNSETSYIHVIRDDDGHLLNEENNLKERWKKLFKSVFAKEDSVVDDKVIASEYMIDDGNENEITMDKIMKAPKRMKIGELTCVMWLYQKC
ncbi:hypothetical protein EVAR_7442_1 [Eumeta japonica]|uniref:Uncharacterized protein n=1 Tax=Eumeta variegata TaxID=151549 RepID=A0A4C1V6W4_EUMVA|nr:hypothetical protein EVAR_7442_1 [Eumeta japonica]